MPSPRKQLPECAVQRASVIIGGRWKTLIIFHLLRSPLRFSALLRVIDDCAERVLTRQLRALENDGVIRRRSLGGKPPKVEYSLTPLGEQLHRVFDALRDWGSSHAASAGATLEHTNPLAAIGAGAPGPSSAAPRRTAPGMR